MRSALVLALVMLGALGCGSTASAEVSPQPERLAKDSYGRLPLHFEANEGQTDSRVRFMARGSGYSLFLTPTESVLVVRRRDVTPRADEPKGPKPASSPASADVLRLRLLGANPNPVIEGRDQLPGRSNYFIGNDPARWRTNVAQYARVNYQDVYPGVSLTYYGNQRQLEYDFVVAPGGDPGAIRLGIEGAEDARLDGDGNLVLSTPGGDVVEHAPILYQETAGVRKAVAGGYVLRGKREVGFSVGAHDLGRPLVIDPVLSYSTYLGGNGYDGGSDIAVDASGNAYVTGDTGSTNFPTANPLQAALVGYGDVFVAKLNAAGSALVYSTYLGGNDGEEGKGIAVDGSGNAYVTGFTASTNFPTVNPLVAANEGSWDAFVAKLNAAGSALVYSTYLGGDGYDQGNTITVDGSGNAYVTGGTYSTNFPTANPLQAANGGARDAFVAKLNPAGSALVYSTYLGGSFDDLGVSIAVDGSGNAYVTGFTFSSNFPTANPLQAAPGGGAFDAFVTKLNAAGSVPVYSTYLGGDAQDGGGTIVVDGSGSAYVTGHTNSANFPTANPLQGAFGGGVADAFVTKLNAAGSALVYSTYLGGNSTDAGYEIAVDGSGNAYVTGYTLSTNFATANPFQATYGGGYDAFMTKLNPAGSALVYSTYFGGSGDEVGTGIAVDGSGNAYVTGYTDSTNFPTANPLQAPFGGGNDAFVARIEALPLGVSIGDAVVPEGNSAITSATLTVSLSSPSSAPVFLSYATADGTATAGSDYIATAGTLTFSPGTTVKTIAVPVFGDHVVEADETLFVNLSGPTNVTILDGQGVGTITNDDSPGFSVNDVAVVERRSGSTIATFIVTLAPTSGSRTSVDFATADGTATAASGDYNVASGTLTLPPGTASLPVSVTVNSDSFVEGAESFTIGLTNPQGGPSVAFSPGAATILDPQGGADFDGDGKTDILFRHAISGRNVVWFMDGITRTSGVYTNPAQLPDTNWRIVGTNDFSSDGKVDILWRHALSGRNVVWYMNGITLTSGVFTIPDSLADTRWGMVGTGDFNVDGKPDILWRHGVSGKNVVWYMDGITRTGGVFTVPDALADTYWQMVGVGDFSSDARADILWRHRLSGKNVVWTMDGIFLTSGVFTNPDQLSEANWQMAAVGDFNSDDKPDILFRHAVSGKNVVWYMDGITRTTGVFTNPAQLPDTNWKIVGPK